MININSDWLTDLKNILTDATSEKIETLDLTKQKDLNEFLEICEQLRSNNIIKSLYNIFENNDYDKFIDDLKNFGYKTYTQAQADKTKTQCDEKEQETCDCEDCMCGTCIDEDDFKWDYNKNVKTGDICVALNKEHFPVYIGKLTHNDEIKFTLSTPKQFIDENGIELADSTFSEITLLKSFWTLDSAEDDEIQIYNGKNPYEEMKFPSFGLNVATMANIDKMVCDYMNEYANLFDNDCIESVKDDLREYTAYIMKGGLLNKQDNKAKS